MRVGFVFFRQACVREFEEFQQAADCSDANKIRGFVCKCQKSSLPRRGDAVLQVVFPFVVLWLTFLQNTATIWIIESDDGKEKDYSPWATATVTPAINPLNEN